MDGGSWAPRGSRARETWIVESSKTVTNDQLRAKLIELIKEQKKPYGSLIDDIAGGFTFTGRGKPQAFQVQPLVVYRVFADGRPDQFDRRRGHRGHSSAALTKIVATGDKQEGVQRVLRSGVWLSSGRGGCAGDFDIGVGGSEERNVDGSTTNFAGAFTRYGASRSGRCAVNRVRLLQPMAKVMVFAVMALIWVVMPAGAAAGAAAKTTIRLCG